MQNGCCDVSFYGHLDEVADEIPPVLSHAFLNLFHIDLEDRTYGGEYIVHIHS